MKKKTKKLCLMVAGVISSVALGLACASCKEPDSIVLENFEDVEITALLDGSYTLPIGNVTDTKGNDYRVTFEVKTASGKTINPSNNAFRLKYFEDYYIICTTDLGGGDVRTRTITIKVQDEGAPAISFVNVRRGIVGNTYTLPSTVVEDSSQETLSASLRVFELNGDEKGKEMTVTENTFVPDRMGYYLIEATATDSNGNVGTETTTMYAREVPEDNEIVSFKYAEDIECVGWSQKNGSITWEETFEGETGVAKFSYTGGYWANAFSVLPLQDVSANSSLYDDYDTLIVRMYIRNDDEYTNYFTANEATQMVISKNAPGSDKVVEKAYHTKSALAYNQWVDFAFDIDAISAWDNDVLNIYEDKLWGYGVKKFDTDGVTEIAHKGEFYVAGIFCSNKVEVTASASSLVVGNTVTFSTDASDPNVTYTLIKPDGTKQTLIGNTYTLEQIGVHTVKVVGDNYYGETTFTATRPLDSENEFLSFNHANDITHVYSTSSSLEIVDEWEGETGVLKIESSNQYPTVAIKPMQRQAEVATYDRVAFKVWLPTGTGATKACVHNTENSKNHSAVDGTATLTEGAWHDVKFAIASVNNWSDEWTAQQLFGKTCSFWFDIGEAKASTIYIADVRLEKKVNVSVSGTISIGGTITVNATDPKDNTSLTISGSTITITAPSGKTTMLTGNTYTIEEHGEHTVSLTGKYVGSTTFGIRTIGEKELLSFNYADDATRVYAGKNGENKDVAITWLNAYEGETGVIKIEYDGTQNAHQWPAFAFQSYKTQAEIATYSRVVFRVYIPTGTGVTKANVHNTDASKNHSAVDGTATLTEGEWIDIKFSVAGFTNWTDGATASELFGNKCQFFLTLGEKKASTIYIADISLA